MILSRNNTKKVQIGNKILGGENRIYIQSMTNTPTKNVEETVKQILELESFGCDLIRVAVLDDEDANSLSQIKKRIHIPLIADIHFSGKLAKIAILQGVDKIRLNPGNLKNEAELNEIIDLAKEHNVAIRIGINSGSFQDKKPSPMEMIHICKEYLKPFEKKGFNNLVLSFKTSDPDLFLQVNELAGKEFPYPLHLGLTEAGPLVPGITKSSIVLYQLLKEGYGNTIRISLTGDPKYEVFAAKEILTLVGERKGPKFVSCPTCGRTQYDMIPLANEVYEYINTLPEMDLKVAVMGCVVNGPGEARDADIGIAGGKNQGILFQNGKIITTIKGNSSELLEEMKKGIQKIILEKNKI